MSYSLSRWLLASLQQVGVWMERALAIVRLHDPNPVAIEVDESRYDAKQVKSMEFEVKLAQNRIKPRFKTQLTALSYKLKEKPMYMKGCKACVYRRRQSGDGDTTAGNSELNGLKSLWISKEALIMWYKENHSTLSESEKETVLFWLGLRGFADSLKCFPCLILVVGDDMYCVTTRIIGEAIMKYCKQLSADLGFESKIKMHTNARAGEFCSSWFCRADLNGEVVTVLTPKPGRTLTRAMYSIDYREDPALWAAGVALGLASNYRHIPGVYEYYMALARCHPKATVIRDRHAFTLNDFDEFRPCAETDIDIAERYKVDPVSWKRMWSHLQAQAVGGLDLDFDLSLMLFERDCEVPEAETELTLRQQ